MKYSLRAKLPPGSPRMSEHSEQLRVLFDYAIKNFGSIRIVNEFSQLPGGESFEWGEVRYVEIPTEYAPQRLQDAFFKLAESQNILVESPDIEPKKLRW